MMRLEGIRNLAYYIRSTFPWLTPPSSKKKKTLLLFFPLDMGKSSQGKEELCRDPSIVSTVLDLVTKQGRVCRLVINNKSVSLGF